MLCVELWWQWWRRQMHDYKAGVRVRVISSNQWWITNYIIIFEQNSVMANYSLYFFRLVIVSVGMIFAVFLCTRPFRDFLSLYTHFSEMSYHLSSLLIVSTSPDVLLCTDTWHSRLFTRLLRSVYTTSRHIPWYLSVLTSNTFRDAMICILDVALICITLDLLFYLEKKSNWARLF